MASFNDRAQFCRAGHAGIQPRDYADDRVHDYRTAERAAQMSRANRWRRAGYKMLIAAAWTAAAVVVVAVACLTAGN